MTFIYRQTISEGIMKGHIDSTIIERYFPTLKEMTYLNNAATGILPSTALDAMKEYLEGRIRAKRSLDDTLNKMDSIRAKLSRLLGGSPAEYALAPSTSVGLNTLAHGIEYPEGSNIVICDLEFPANYVPWQNASRLYGVELRIVPSREGAVNVSDFADRIDENTRVVAISMVQFGSGFRADISAIAKTAHEHDAFLVADIIQAAGWHDINLPKIGVDLASAQAAKWLIGPIGAGFIYVSKDIMDRVKPRYLGWWGVEDMRDFSYFERTPAKSAKRYEIGSPALIAYVGFDESLDLLLSIPAKEREAVALGNAEYLRECLREMGLEHYEFEEQNKSPIVSCVPDDVERLEKELRKDGIHCSVRNGRLRISPHFYNTTEEIDRLVEKMR